MLASNYNDPQTYRRTLMIYGGEAQEGFVHQVKKILQRYFRQTDKPAPPDPALVHFGNIIWKLVEEKGLPPALEGSDQGVEAEMSPEDIRSRLDSIWSSFRFVDYKSDLEVPARHLVKGIWQPEFKKCRMSYKEANDSDKCERQDLSGARARISGSHCVDCPYWVSVTAEKNEKLLTKEWAPDSVAELTSHLTEFLPEDYRQLRQLLYMHARFGSQ